jgi:hypothetical protein
MTIEELRKTYAKETGHKYKLNEGIGDVYACGQITWLEQKLTQPCPSCKLAESIIGNLKKKCNEYYEEIETYRLSHQLAERELDKHKRAVEKFIKYFASIDNPCPFNIEDKPECITTALTVDCYSCLRKWAYEADKK